MKTWFRANKRLLATLFLLAAALFAVDFEFRVYERALFALREWLHAREWRDRSLWLPDYRLALEVEVEGVERNLSGLTWNNDTKTLFAVVNHPPQLVELSTSGKPLRRIALVGFDDTEAAEYIGDNRFIIAEERKQNLSLAVIDADTLEVRAQGLPRLTLGTGPAGNQGIEGLAWDFSTRRLYAGKERFPVHIYEVSGFPQAPNTTLDIEIGGNRARDSRLFVSDVSGLDFNPRFQHLLVLSDASKLLLELDKSGEPISSMSLIMGHGLRVPVPQAEGLAMDDEENLYIVSEPNLFYVFRKSTGDGKGR